MINKPFNRTVQLTVRGVPARVKKTLSTRAETEQKSLNTVLVEALSTAAGVDLAELRHDDLNELAGLWQDDPAFDEAIRAQDLIDESMWK